MAKSFTMQMATNVAQRFFYFFKAAKKMHRQAYFYKTKTVPKQAQKGPKTD